MTRISIDDNVDESDQWKLADRVEDVVKTILSDLPPNRIVTSISVDGQPITRQFSADVLKSRIDAIRDLQIRTADAQVWAVNGLDTAISNVERLQKSLLLAAQLFRDDHKNEGNRIFLRCVEGLEQFLDTIVLTRLAMKLDFQRLNIDGITFARLEKDFSSILGSIVGCQESQDFSGLADKVEYELLPNFHSWTRALNELRLSLNSNA